MGTQRTSSSARASYGIDAPTVVRNLVLLGVVGLVLVVLGFSIDSIVALPIVVVAILCSLFGFSIAGALFWSSRSGKYVMCEELVELLCLKGDETVLDLGCGRGLVLNAAARRLTTGSAIGLDIWRSMDQSANSPDATLANAGIEGVADRVRVMDGDMRQIPLEEGSVDAITSSLAIHNIEDYEGLNQAFKEIARVLKPGGRVALLDFKKTQQYASFLSGRGFSDVRVSGLHFRMFPPVRIVTAKKPF